MPAYMIAQIRIDDKERYQSYLAGFMPVFERHGGELLVSSSNPIEVIEGKWNLDRVVVMKFPDADAARAWKNDPEYQALAQHRFASAATNLIMVDGIA